VIPVDQYLNSISDYTSQQKLLAISWGIHQVATGLAFLINDCNLNHNNVFSGSVFVTTSGTWKISGFEYVTSAVDSTYPAKNLSCLDKYTPPDGGGTRGTKW
jgi:SCY1-like protein 1